MRNRARCLRCKDVIESRSRHDFVTCKCGSIWVDGGHDYIRRGGNLFDEAFDKKELDNKHVCIKCEAPNVVARHCKLVCSDCGYTQDCSDLWR